MIGLGRHEMTAWLWSFSVGLTIALAGLTALSLCIPVRLADGERGEGAAHD